MKPPLRLAALLLLPASLAPAGEPLAFGPAYFAQQADYHAAPTGLSETAAPSWQWPLAPRPQVLRDFNPPPKPWLSGHRGVDLGAAADGAPVTSPAAGTVSFVGVVVDRPVITIDMAMGCGAASNRLTAPWPPGPRWRPARSSARCARGTAPPRPVSIGVSGAGKTTWIHCSS